MRIGHFFLKIRQRFAHGLRTAYYRDLVRPRITSTEPVEKLTDTTCEIHVLTSNGDFLNLLWVLKSFYWATGQRYSLCVHDDGSLEDKHAKQLKHHFPDSRIIWRQRANEEVLPKLEEHPRCYAFRAENHLAPKLFDFVYYLQGDQLLLLDSDVLFFEEPTELLWRIEDPSYQKNTANRDVDTAYTVDPSDVQSAFGFSPVPRFNSGLGLIHSDSIRLDWIEQFLDLPNIRSHFWRTEQTLFALCSSRYDVELLPEPYDVHLGKGIRGPVRHYVGAVRHLMYSEGIKILRQQT